MPKPQHVIGGLCMAAIAVSLAWAGARWLADDEAQAMTACRTVHSAAVCLHTLHP